MAQTEASGRGQLRHQSEDGFSNRPEHSPGEGLCAECSTWNTLVKPDAHRLRRATRPVKSRRTRRPLLTETARWTAVCPGSPRYPSESPATAGRGLRPKPGRLFHVEHSPTDPCTAPEAAAVQPPGAPVGKGPSVPHPIPAEETRTHSAHRPGAFLWYTGGDAPGERKAPDHSGCPFPSRRLWAHRRRRLQGATPVPENLVRACGRRQEWLDAIQRSKP